MPNVFDDRTLVALNGDLAIGHTRYSTTGSQHLAQRPARVPRRGRPGVRPRPQRQPHQHRGAGRRRRDAARACLSSDSDLLAELLANHMRRPGGDLAGALAAVLPDARGGLLAGAADDGRHLSASATRTASGRCASAASTAAGCWPARRPPSTSSGPGSSASWSRARWWSSTATAPASFHPFPAERIDPRLCLFEFVYFARPDAQLYGRNVDAARVRMGEQLAEQAPLPPDTSPAEPAGPGGAGARERRARGPGVRPRQRHPVRRRAGEEPLHRADVHRAQPGAAGPRRADEAQPAAGEHRGQAPGGGRRLDRAGHHHPGRRGHAARVGRRRGAPADHVAALSVAVLLRDGHGRPRRAAGGPPDRSRRSGHFVGADSLAYLDLDRLHRGHRGGRRRLLRRLPHRQLPGRRTASRCTRPCSSARADGDGRDVRAPPASSLDAADEVVARLGRHVRSTCRPEVLSRHRRLRRARRACPPATTSRCWSARPTVSARS